MKHEQHSAQAKSVSFTFTRILSLCLIVLSHWAATISKVVELQSCLGDRMGTPLSSCDAYHEPIVPSVGTLPLQTGGLEGGRHVSNTCQIPDTYSFWAHQVHTAS